MRTWTLAGRINTARITFGYKNHVEVDIVNKIICDCMKIGNVAVIEVPYIVSYFISDYSLIILRIL